MRFYDCNVAPSPRRVRIFIAEKGLDIPTVEVDLRSREQLSDEFRKINPECTVPVLQLDDGAFLANTAGIRRYLEEVYPQPPLLGSTAEEKALVAEWQWRIEMDGFMGVAEALRNSAKAMENRALTGPVDYAQIPELAERGKKRTEHFLASVDGMIGDKPYVVGENYTAADIDLLVMVDFAGWLKMKLPEDAPNAQRWYASVSSRPSAKL